MDSEEQSAAVITKARAAAPSWAVKADRVGLVSACTVGRHSRKHNSTTKTLSD